MDGVFLKGLHGAIMHLASQATALVVSMQQHPNTPPEVRTRNVERFKLHSHFV